MGGDAVSELTWESPVTAIRRGDLGAILQDVNWSGAETLIEALPTQDRRFIKHGAVAHLSPSVVDVVIYWCQQEGGWATLGRLLRGMREARLNMTAGHLIEYMARRGVAAPNEIRN